MRRLLSLVAALSSIALPAAAADIGPWKPAGAIPGGELNSLVIDTAHPGVVFAGSNGGLIFRSTDGGVSWTPIQVGDGNESFRAIAVSPAGAGTLFAYSATESGIHGNGARVFRSTDDGLTWALTSGQPTASQTDYDLGNAALVDSTGQIVILSNNHFGIYRSTDGGATWTQSLDSARTWGLAEVPETPDTIWSTGESNGVPAVFKSTDFGATWSVQTPSALDPPGAYRGYGIAIQPQSDDIFVTWNGSDPSTGASIAGVVISRNGGATWKASDTGLQSDYYGGNPANSFAFDPASPSTIFLATNTDPGPGGAYVSNNSGKSWIPIGSRIPEARAFSIATFPAETGFAASTLGGQTDVESATPSGQAWRFSDKGYDNNVAFFIVDDGLTAAGYYGATQSGVYHSLNNGAAWNRLANAPGPGGKYVQSLVVDRLLDPPAVYAAGPTEIWRSTNAGMAWADITPTLATGEVITTLYISPVRADEIYGLSTLSLLYRSTDGGSTWTSSQIGNPGDYVNQVAVSRQHPGTLYAVLNSGLWVSHDDGATWALNAKQPAPFAFLSYVAEIEGTNPRILVSGDDKNYDGRTVRSTDGGATFPAVAALTGMPAGPYEIFPSPAKDFAIALGGFGDLQFSSNSGVTWMDKGTSLFDNLGDGGSVSMEDSIAFFSSDNGPLYSATYTALKASSNVAPSLSRFAPKHTLASATNVSQRKDAR